MEFTSWPRAFAIDAVTDVAARSARQQFMSGTSFLETRLQVQLSCTSFEECVLDTL